MTASVFRGLALFLIHYFAFGVIDEALYEKSLGAINPYVSALSVVFGVYVFGFEGVVFGPLLVCGVSFVYELSGHSIQAAQDETATPGRQKKGKLSTQKAISDPDMSSRNIFSNAYRAISRDGSLFSSPIQL